VALGAGSTVTANNQVNVGGRTVSGVAAGAVTATSTDAVNGAQLYATNQAIAAISTNVAGLQGQIDDLVDVQRHDRKEARRGVAAAVALTEAPMPSRDGGVSYSLHGATYRGQYAVGGSLKYRINRSVAIDAGASFAGNKDTAVRAGFSGEF
jgi:autotransporter adhesin